MKLRQKRSDEPMILGNFLERAGLLEVRPMELPNGHFCFLGVSGSGKSYLTQDLTIELIQRGEGVTIVDPAGDLADDILARVGRLVLDTGDKSILDRVHWLEPGNYTMLFGLDPGRFDPAKPIHPEHFSNAMRAWLHTRVMNLGEWVQLKQGQMDFEQNARLQRILTKAFTAGLTPVNDKGKHLPLPLVLILFFPEIPGSEEAFEQIAPKLDQFTLADIRRIRGTSASKTECARWNRF